MYVLWSQRGFDKSIRGLSVAPLAATGVDEEGVVSVLDSPPMVDCVAFLSGNGKRVFGIYLYFLNMKRVKYVFKICCCDGGCVCLNSPPMVDCVAVFSENGSVK